MVNTISLNTIKKAAVIKCLVVHFNATIGPEIHILECMFHVNEIYFNHLITYVDGMEKAPATMQSGAVLNNFTKQKKPDIETTVSLLRYFTDVLFFFNFKGVS